MSESFSKMLEVLREEFSRNLMVVRPMMDPNPGQILAIRYRTVVGGKENREARLAVCSEIAGRNLSSLKELTSLEAAAMFRLFADPYMARLVSMCDMEMRLIKERGNGNGKGESQAPVDGQA